MITLFASIAGFISSIFPDLIKFFLDKGDKSHELAIMDKQIELTKLGLGLRLQEINTSADIAEIKAIYSTYKTGNEKIDFFNGSVRPLLAYAFFILYASIKFLQIIMLENNNSLDIILNILWNEDDKAIFASIISFYFGQRSFAKIRGLK